MLIEGAVTRRTLARKLDNVQRQTVRNSKAMPTVLLAKPVVRSLVCHLGVSMDGERMCNGSVSTLSLDLPLSSPASPSSWLLLISGYDAITKGL